MGTPGPPSLEKFKVEQQLWQRLGTNWAEFRQRPRKEVEEYLIYIQLICREEQMDRDRPAGKPQGR
jgi:hypothetical protein